MDDKTTIQYEAVKNASDEITNRSKNMDETFDKFRETMANIYKADVLEGEAGDSLEEKFNVLKTKLDAYIETVQQFSAIIEKARSETHATEQEIKREAEDLAE